MRSSELEVQHKECEYQPYTATGKLNADKTPRTPRGFGTVSYCCERLSNDDYEESGDRRGFAFKYGMAWPLRADHSPIHHPRKANCIITLPDRGSVK